MAAKIHGRLGAIDLGATTNTGVYTVPSGRKSTVSVSLCNRTGSAIPIRLAHIAGAIGTVADSDYLEYGFSLAGNSSMERTGITMTATHTLMAYAAATGISVVVTGVEEDV